MARLNSLPKNTLIRDIPNKDKMQLALQWLRENPTETPTTAARCHGITRERSVRQAWRREKERDKRTKKLVGGSGQNKILHPDHHQAMIRYAADQAVGGGMGATKQMMFNCAVWLRVQDKKPVPTWRWFQTWLKNTPELHTIKTKPIARHRVDMHTEADLREWFENEYRPALEYTGVKSGKYIHNMDEKGCRIACPAGEEVVVPIGIKEMYVGVPENRLSLTVIESISADGKAIPPVVIVPGGTIMESWFHENMTGHEVVAVSPSGYTNEEICVRWLDHFIKHNDCGPDQPWRILLIDGATCHEAPEFILRAKMNRIWIVKFPSHQTHLIQPAEVGCFRQWKTFQQKCIMNAIRSFEAEYNVQSFFRDLPEIRERTFTVRTIKHSFQNAGMWPVSFSAVQKKLKEYGKKKKKDTGLEFLEYGSESESEAEGESEPKPDSQPMEEYQLPQLKPPSSYDECHQALRDIDNKVQEALSSPSRAQYKVITESTGVFLMRGSLHEMEVAQARAGAIQTHKRKLHARKSLGKGGSILARDALQKIKDKRRQEADDKLKRAKKAITVAENKAKNALRDRGVQARKDEKARLAFLKANSGLVGVEIPDSMWVPIRDPQKNPTAAEKKLSAPINRYTMLPNVRNENGMRAAQTTLRISQPFLSTLLS
jgi:DDE superfamily endonuclease